MEKLKERLRKKGWTKRETEKAARIIKKARESKTKHLIAVENTIYWTAFLVVVFGNFVISVSLIPMMFALKKIPLFAIIIVMGAAFGLLAEVLMRDLSYLQKSHHILFGVIIPLVAVFNAFIITTIANSMQSFLIISNEHNPFVVGVVYAAAFISPYLYYSFIKKN